MRDTQKKILAVLLASILLLLSSSTSAIVFYNESTTSKLVDVDTSKSVICKQIDGASHFLKAYANILLFLQGIECSETNQPNFDHLNSLLAKVINDLKSTKEIYSNLKKKLNDMPDNPEIKKKLATFDFKGYCKRHRLNCSIFQQVESNLKIGNVDGLYSEALDNIDKMIETTEKMKESLNARKLPESEHLWYLEETYSNTLRKGQYTARVFIEIKNQKEYKNPHEDLKNVPTS